jgi:hypothetical protein
MALWFTCWIVDDGSVRGLGGNDYFAGFVGWGKFEKV